MLRNKLMMTVNYCVLLITVNCYSNRFDLAPVVIMNFIDSNEKHKEDDATEIVNDKESRIPLRIVAPTVLSAYESAFKHYDERLPSNETTGRKAHGKRDTPREVVERCVLAK